jgi:hypothetical protein
MQDKFNAEKAVGGTAYNTSGTEQHLDNRFLPTSILNLFEPSAL